jgi:O-antigen ligase
MRSGVSTTTASPPVAATLGRPPLDLPESLFLLSAFVAPLNVLIVQAFSVYDALVLATGFVLLATRRRIVSPPAGVVVAGYVFLCAATVSTFRATDMVEAVEQLLQFAFIFFIQLPVVLTMARGTLMVRWAVLLFAAGSLAGVVQAMATGRLQGADRVLTFISDNPNRLGYLATYLLPFALYLVTTLWHRGRLLWAVVLGGVLSYLLLWPLAASASRGATAGAIVGLFTYLVLRPGLGPRRALQRIAIVALLVASASWVMLNLQGFSQTLGERIGRTLSPEDQATLLAERQHLALAGLREFATSPLVGTGLDNFRNVAVRYDPLATSQAPHNVWIQSLAQVGLVGTLAFLYLIAWWFRRLYRACALTPVDDAHGGLVLAFIASMASIMTILMTVPIMNQRHYWLLYGLGLALVAHTPSSTSDPIPQPGKEERRDQP